MALETQSPRQRCWALPRMPWLTEALNGGVFEGGSYLLSGPPGSNKTTLCIQMAIEIANLGHRVVLCLNEQGVEHVTLMFARIEGFALPDLPDEVVDNVYLENFQDPADLLSLAQKYRQAPVLIVDSLHGGAMTSVRPSGYRTYAQFFDLARGQNQTVIAVTHVTKAGKMAGPRSLEHQADVCLFLAKAAGFRHFCVTKNRFGPEVVDPVILESTANGLMLSPHQQGHGTSVLGYSGEGDSLLEVQAMVSVPRYGSQPELNAPFLPSRRVRQIINTINTIPGLDLSEMSFVINALLPEPQRYAPPMDLGLAVALISTYLRRGIPERSVFLGGVDLHRQIRPVGLDTLTALALVLKSEAQRPVRRVYLSSSSAGLLAELLSEDTSDSEQGPLIIGVPRLDELLSVLWSEAFPAASLTAS